MMIEGVQRFTRLLALLPLLFGLSGCVWFRLLQAKNQLADFDENYRVETAEYFMLHFRHPTLLSGDFLYLTGLQPTRIYRRPDVTAWWVDFHKLDPDGQAEHPSRTITFQMRFDPDNKLVSFGFSPLFLAMAPAEFLEASIRSIGKGKIDTRHKQLRVDPEDLPRLRAHLPHREDIRAVFGKPIAQANERDGLLWVYRFMADARRLDDREKDNRMAEAKLYFDPATGELIKMAGYFVGLKLKINYRNLTVTKSPKSMGRTSEDGRRSRTSAAQVLDRGLLPRFGRSDQAG